MNTIILVIFFAGGISLSIGYVVYRQITIGRLLNIWRKLGYTVCYQPVRAQCWSTSPDRQNHEGVLGISENDLIFRSDAGEVEIIPVNMVQWVAAGTMWQPVKSYPCLLVRLKDGFDILAVAFWTEDSEQICDYLHRVHGVECTSIPTGYAVRNGRLVMPERKKKKKKKYLA